MIYVNSKLDKIVKFYNFFLKIGSNLQSLFLLAMRLTWGHQFLIIGLDTVRNPHSVIDFFQSYGVPFTETHTFLAGYAEIICGICLMVGFASRIITLPLMFILAFTFGAQHFHILKDFFLSFDPHPLAQTLPYPYFIASAMVFCFGPGRISLDAWIKRWVENQPKY